LSLWQPLAGDEVTVRHNPSLFMVVETITGWARQLATSISSCSEAPIQDIVKSMVPRLAATSVSHVMFLFSLTTNHHFALNSVKF